MKNEVNRTLYIRADMNETIATGHVMRCLSIADAAKDSGRDTVFILADEQAKRLVEGRGHHAIVLGTQWDDMEHELPVLKNVIREHSIQKILIDSYQVTPAYLAELSKLLWTIYIDDLNAFHYQVNAIICYANYWKKFEYEKKYKDVGLYLGPAYVPLRKEFTLCGAKRIREIPENLLLLSGGTDHYHILEKLLQKIVLTDWQRIDVICGRYYTDYERVRDRYKQEKNIFFHQAVTDIERYMRQADVAISAGGSTLYELCATGTPAISYSFADNQLDNVTKFAEDGLIAYAGDARYQDIASEIADILDKQYVEKEARVKRSKRMQTLVDGKGAERIAGIL